MVVHSPNQAGAAESSVEKSYTFMISRPQTDDSLLDRCSMAKQRDMYRIHQVMERSNRACPMCSNSIADLSLAPQKSNSFGSDDESQKPP